MLTSFNDVLAYILSRGDEATDGTSTMDPIARLLMVEAWRELYTEHPFLGLLAFPPQAQVVPAAITTLRLTATAGVQAATLSGVPTGVGGGNISILNWWIIVQASPTGQSYSMRVLAHTAGSTAVTLDAVPETLAAQAVTLALVELTLVTGTGVLASNVYTSGGGYARAPVPILGAGEDELERLTPDLPSSGWPPDSAARVGMTTLRLSHYDSTAPHRVEIPYYQELVDPSGSGALGIPSYLIPAFSEKALALLYEAMGDSRQKLADARYERWMTKARHYEHLLRTTLSGQGQQRRNEPYGDDSSGRL